MSLINFWERELYKTMAQIGMICQRTYEPKWQPKAKYIEWTLANPEGRWGFKIQDDLVFQGLPDEQKLIDLSSLKLYMPFASEES